MACGIGYLSYHSYESKEMMSWWRKTFTLSCVRRLSCKSRNQGERDCCPFALPQPWTAADRVLMKRPGGLGRVTVSLVVW